MRCLVFAVWVALASLAICVQEVRAELPPWAYNDPKNAPEDLDIKVLSVSKRVTEDNDTRTCWDLEVNAEIREVRKTGSGLKVGSRIIIRYGACRHKEPGWTGPGSLPVLEKGEVCSAALLAWGEEKDRYYVPGGAPYNTFVVLPKKK
jgi:hypothetical protein